MVLVAVYCQLAGSDVPSAQARIRMVVVPVPWNWARRRMNWPALRVSPVDPDLGTDRGLDVVDDGARLDEHGAGAVEAQLGAVLSGGADGAGDAVDVLVAAGRRLVGGDPEAEVDVGGRDSAEDRGAVDAAGAEGDRAHLAR